jgi:hypothetical protein
MKTLHEWKSELQEQERDQEIAKLLDENEHMRARLEQKEQDPYETNNVLLAAKKKIQR